MLQSPTVLTFVNCNVLKRPKTTITGFSGVRVARSLLFCIMLCRSLFVLLTFVFFFVIVLAVLRFTDSVYLFAIFKHVLINQVNSNLK